MRSYPETLEKMLSYAPINRLYKPTDLIIGKGEASFSMPVLKEFFNGGHVLHGSVYFKGLDDAAWFAANSISNEIVFVTTSFTTYFMHPVVSGNLQVVAKVISACRSLVVVEANMFNDGDRLVAHGTGTFQPSQIPISDLFNSMNRR